MKQEEAPDAKQTDAVINNYSLHMSLLKLGLNRNTSSLSAATAGDNCRQGPQLYY